MLDLKGFDHSQRKLERRRQIQGELDAVQRRITGRLDDFEQDTAEASIVARHRSQLATVRDVLAAVTDNLGSRAAALADQAGSGAVAVEARRLGEAVVWLERLWDFIAYRLGQRFERGADASLRALVQAADEVSWSCYRTVTKNLPPTHAVHGRKVAPLTYVEAEYSPAALQVDRPLPTGLRLVSGDAALDGLLARTPLPMLRLPPWCIRGPWWIVFVAHEIGHHVQHELRLVQHVATAIAAAVPAAAASRWQAWSEEIFADAFSVMNVGLAAARAIAEVEWAAPQALVRRRASYPSTVVRIGLMLQLARGLGIEAAPGDDALAPWRQLAASDEAAAEDWKASEAVVAVLLTDDLAGLGPLPRLCGFEASAFAPRRSVDTWSQAFLGHGQLRPEHDLASARLMASAALAAWCDLAEREAGPDSEAAWATFAASVSPAIAACAEPGKRAASAAERAAAAEAAIALADMLFETSSSGPA